MAFCWYTSFIGFPNFFASSGSSYDLAQAFATFCEASNSGISYKESKGLFPNLDASQVETKKAAFQEYGLLYVIPRSDVISITPLGQQIYSIYKSSLSIEKKRRQILLSLCNALSNYQFNNPFPVGGNRYRSRAMSTTIKPYLCAYLLLRRLGGILTRSEIMGIVFGIQESIASAEDLILKHRDSQVMPTPLACLPKNEKTAENLKIYFLSHLSLDGEIIASEYTDIYGEREQAYEMTQLGKEIISTSLDSNWPGWRDVKLIDPVPRTFNSIKEYFEIGVGQSISDFAFKKDEVYARKQTKAKSVGLVDFEDIENLKDLPLRKFEEGRTRLVNHSRIEKIRNPALVREAKNRFKSIHGKLFCEVCFFDFKEKYGNRGEDFIEAHHKIPVSELEQKTTLTIEDMAMVCSNCHRMLHKQPWVSIEELKIKILEDAGMSSEL